METVFTILVTAATLGAIVAFARGVREEQHRKRLEDAVNHFLIEVEWAKCPPCWPGPCHAGNCRTPDWCNKLARVYALLRRPRPRIGADGRPVGAKEGRMV